MDPAGKPVIESPTSRYWFDDDGVLCAVSKGGKEPSLAEREKSFNDFKKTLSGKKICMIMDISDSSPTSKESRSFNSKVLPEVFKAIAFISRSPLGKMLAHLYLGLAPPAIPTRIFSKEKDAREWIKKYI